MAETVIYLSPKHITVTRGVAKKNKKDVRLLHTQAFPIPDGAVLNGVITDEESLYGAFAPIKEALGAAALKDATLVLDTTHIIFRLTVLPVVSEKNMLKLVMNEFAGRTTAEKEYVYDYSVLPSKRVAKKQRQVLCLAVDKAIVDAYKAFFKRVGITLGGMNFSTNTILQAFKHAGCFDDKHAVICVVDHYIVSIVSLLGNGEANFHRSRIISQVSDEGYFDEISDVIYSYVQSRVSVDRQESVEVLRVFDSNVYAPEKYAAVAQRLRILDIGVHLGECIPLLGVLEEDSAKYIYNICALYSKVKSNKDINLLKTYEIKPVNKKRLAGGVLTVAALAAVGAVGFYLFTLYTETNTYRTETEEINMFLFNPQTIQAMADFSRLSGEQRALQNMIAIHGGYALTVALTPIAVSEVLLSGLDVFGSKADITSISFEVENGYISISLELEDPAEISYFVGLLRSTGLFRDISYTGYASSGGNAYNFLILCHLRELKSVD